MADKMANHYLNRMHRRINEYLIYKTPRVRNTDFMSFKKELLPTLRPVFFLSTGRTGTAFFARLLNRTNQYQAFHFPFPDFTGENVQAYKLYRQTGMGEAKISQALAQTFVAGRQQLLHKNFLYGKRYCETNNNLTFFAPALKYLFPEAKFVFVHRHPGEFIRSGLRRQWYQAHRYDIGRIYPDETSFYSQKWDQASSLEKIAWLWKETNEFILDFKEMVEAKDFYRFDFSEMNHETVQQLLQFMEADLPAGQISKLLKRPVNKQANGTYPEYENWSEQDKSSVRDICSQTAHKLGYKL
ncbi:MAG: sulfotransferase [Bacteroidales bacterium]|nr:sulfotransferase [Bacteroidales bacterium]